MKKSGKWKIAQAAEIRWWNRYLKNKNRNIYLDWKRKYWLQLFSKISTQLELKGNAMILDAGCSPAGIFMILDNFQVDGFDPLIDAYEKELDIFEKKLYPFVRFHNVPMEAITEQEKYDLVFSMNAINHVSDLFQAVQRICLAAKPGKKIVVSVDAHRYWLIKHLLRIVPWDIYHPHQYSIGEYEQIFVEQHCIKISRIKLKSNLLFRYYVLIFERTKQGSL